MGIRGKAKEESNDEPRQEEATLRSPALDDESHESGSANDSVGRDDSWIVQCAVCER